MTLCGKIEPALTGLADELIAHSDALRLALATADRLASSTCAVLLMGETGTGKELLARRLHLRSKRPGQLVAVNCAGLRPEMADNLLFGHDRGAYTDARTSTIGHVRSAHRGTLFLDEVTSLPMESQAKLLRVLDRSEVQPVGSDRLYWSDVRYVAAAQPAIGRAVERQEFREDLYQRLSAGIVTLAPLRERPEDVVPMAEYFCRKEGAVLAASAHRALLRHDWPGNVRELKSVILRARVCSDGPVVGEREVSQAVEAGRIGSDGSAVVRLVEERQRLEALVAEAQGDWRQLMALMQVSRSTLYRQLQRVGIVLKQPRQPSFPKFPGNS